MIPIQQLRIGNYVMADNTLQRVVLINSKASLTHPIGVKLQQTEFTHEVDFSLSQIEPVAMTDAVLKHCGFTYDDYFKFWKLITGADATRYEMDIDRDYAVIDFMRKPVVKKVASLHQLQNVYFALCDRELNVDAENFQLSLHDITVVQVAQPALDAV